MILLCVLFSNSSIDTLSFPVKLHLFLVSLRMKKAKTDFKEYMEAFGDELRSFLKRVKERAEARIEKAMKEHEEV